MFECVVKLKFLDGMEECCLFVEREKEQGTPPEAMAENFIESPW
jgi:hypothetical protein